MSACPKALWLALSITTLGLVLIGLSLAQETPGEQKQPPQEIPEEPASPAEEPESPAREAPALTVTAAICTEIQDREPVGAGEAFPATVGQLYCHTLVEGCEDSTKVTHVWVYGEKKMAEVTLPVASPRWRTWSSKKIVESWVGQWHVEVLDVTGHALTSIPFQIQ